MNLLSCKNTFELPALRPEECLHVSSDVFLAEITVAPFLTIVTSTVRIRFKKLLNKKEYLGTKIQFTVVHDSI